MPRQAEARDTAASSSGVTNSGVVQRLCDQPRRASSASGPAPARAPASSQTGHGPSRAARPSADRRSRFASRAGSRNGPSQPGRRSCPMSPPPECRLCSPPWDRDDDPPDGVVEDQVADSEDQDEDEPADDGLAIVSAAIVLVPAVAVVLWVLVALVVGGLPVLRAEPFVRVALLAPAVRSLIAVNVFVGHKTPPSLGWLRGWRTSPSTTRPPNHLTSAPDQRPVVPGPPRSASRPGCGRTPPARLPPAAIPPSPPAPAVPAPDRAGPGRQPPAFAARGPASPDRTRATAVGPAGCSGRGPVPAPAGGRWSRRPIAGPAPVLACPAFAPAPPGPPPVAPQLDRAGATPSPSFPRGSRGAHSAHGHTARR